jgi:hypothetical protein
MKRSRCVRSIGNVIPVFLAILTVVATFVPGVQAEPVAPSVHWGAIAYPDRDETLTAGFTANRFTEFGPNGERFSSVDESSGFNFATISWTHRVRALPGWNTNLTVGAGPTYPEPTYSLQNGFVHDLLNNNVIPVGRRREETDFMVNGSVTRWLKLFGERETGFASLGFASGSLNHETFARVGLRRVSLAEVLEPVVGKNTLLRGFSRFVRFSGMGQYGRVFGGSAYGDAVVAPQSYLAQGSISIGIYDDLDAAPPRWELEFAATIDSGLFVNPGGRSIERRFGSIALRFPYGVVETWNDLLGGTDSGPTYGFHVMFDLRRIYGRLTAP